MDAYIWAENTIQNTLFDYIVYVVLADYIFCLYHYIQYVS